MLQPADRLQHIQEYYFSSKLRQLRELREAGHPVINLGIGSPDLMPHPSVVEALAQAATRPEAHGYQPYQGIPELVVAVKQFYQKHFGVNLANYSVLPLMGSKEGITHVSLAYLNPGDEVLIPALGYPTYTSVTRMVGGVPVYFPLRENTDWEPDWDFLEKLDTSRVKLMWINYPHMPTGASAPREWLERLVAYATERSLLLCHDNPYSFVLNDQPLSIFSVPGAQQVALELNSLSKTFNMAGWRVGWVSGQPELIQPVLKIKSNMDSGMFLPVQLAAVQALSLPAEWYEAQAAVYRERREVVFRMLEHWGCQFSRAQCGMFVWARVPQGSGEAFSDALLSRCHVFVTPGFIFGAAGDAFIRISLCAPKEVFEEAQRREA